MVTGSDQELKREQKMLKCFYSVLFGTVVMSCLWLNGNFKKVIERRDRLKTQHRVRRGIIDYISRFSLKLWTSSASLKAVVALQDMDLKERITKVHVSAVNKILTNYYKHICFYWQIIGFEKFGRKTSPSSQSIEFVLSIWWKYEVMFFIWQCRGGKREI